MNTKQRPLTEAERTKIASIRAELEDFKAHLASLDWMAPHRARVASLEAKLAKLERRPVA